MAIVKYTINSIFGGQASTRHGAGKGHFMGSQGIDPELQINGKASGYIMPLTHDKFSGATVTGVPMWIEVGVKGGNNKVYIYNSDGELISYNNALASETLESAGITNGNGSGMAQINDHLLLATTTNIAIFGQLSAAAPAVTNSWWTGVAGLSALTDTAYPSIRGVEYPNHAMHNHTDGKTYFCDFAAGVGMIHKLGITAAGANDGSAFNVLDLPLNIHPTDIESYGTDLAIIGSSFIEAGSAQLEKGTSSLFLWDTVSDSFYRQVPVPSAFVTAILNVNGNLFIWGTSANAGWQMYRYAGGYSVEVLWDSSTGTGPIAGGVDVQNGRVFFGGVDTASDYDDAVVYAYGYQSPDLPSNALNCISNLGLDNSAESMIGALKTVDASTNLELPIIGWTSNGAFGMSKPSTSDNKTSFFDSETFVVGKAFKIREVNIPVTKAVTSGVIIEPTIQFDQTGDIKQLTAISDAVYNGKTKITYKAHELDQLSITGATGSNDFFLSILFNGTSNIGVGLPIEIIVETLDE